MPANLKLTQIQNEPLQIWDFIDHPSQQKKKPNTIQTTSLLGLVCVPEPDNEAQALGIGSARAPSKDST